MYFRIALWNDRRLADPSEKDSGMQLATSQRPHPPPVPPRPSRQVVAEALKRSPRPPCPTRQAPPPPNTKPWRSNQQQSQQQQQQACPTVGRTIVYESIKECAKDCKDEGVPNDGNQRDCLQQARGSSTTAERNAEDNGGGRAENPAERRKSNDVKIPSHDHQHQHEASGVHGASEKPRALCSTAGNVPASVVARKRNSPTEDQRPRRSLEIRRVDSRGKDRAAADPSGKDQRRENAAAVATAERVVEVAVTDRTREQAEAPGGVTVRSIGNASSSSLFDDDVRRASSSTGPDSGVVGRAAVSQSAEKFNGGSTGREASERDARPTPTCRSCPGEQQQQQEASLANEKATGNGAEVVSSFERSGPTSPTNVNRATTVLVVDEESEGKIALSDEDDDNDNDSDNNIHRQDWLEAGVRYSSTQITLHGDGNGDAVDGDRVNGYDDREEERISDLDFIR